MSEFTCSIVSIESVIPHPNADGLEIAHVLGDYPVIIRKDQFKPNDLALYLSPDCVVPDTEMFHFVSPNKTETYLDENGDEQVRAIGKKYPVGSVPMSKRRLRSKRIREVYSMGLLLEAPEGATLGQDLAETLGVIKYDEEAQEILRNGRVRTRGRNAEKAPTTFTLPYYDIESIRRNFDLIDPNREIVITQKCHGTNVFYVHDGEKLWVKSRNFFKKKDERDTYWDVALRYGLEEKLNKYPMLAFAGEILGVFPKFIYDTKLVDGFVETTFKVFDVYNVQTQTYLDYDEACAIVDDLGLDLVPLLYRGPMLSKEELYLLAEGPDVINPAHVREGIVLKQPAKEGDRMRKQFKLIGEGFDLAK